jgi:hypothetical protein
MKKPLPFLWAALVCLLCLTGSVQAQNSFRTPAADLKAISKAVAGSRAAWQTMFPANELPEFGFRDQHELASATPGQPIEIYLMGHPTQGTTRVVSANEFFIPLQLNGHTRAFLKVAYHENRYQVVAAGEMNLASDASDYIKKANAAGQSRLIWLTDVNHSADFISVPTTSLDVEFTPLSTAKRASIMEPVLYSQLVQQVQAMPLPIE